MRSLLVGLLLLLVGAIGTLATLAQASPEHCGPIEYFERLLSERYGERPIGGGLKSPQVMLQLWVSEAGTWSVLQVRADGLACLTASGQHWQVPSAKPAEPEGDPS